MKKLLAYVLARLKEPSSYAGISALLLALGVSPEVTEVVGTHLPLILSGISAFVAVLLKDKESV